MDYRKLAVEFFKDLHSLKKARPQKHISESLRGETFAMQYIAYHDGPVLPGEISNEMGISSARIAATLNTLEAKGLVTRRIDERDRRRILVELTEAGRQREAVHAKHMLDVMVQMLKDLGEEDAKEFLRILKKLSSRVPEDFFVHDNAIK